MESKENDFFVVVFVLFIVAILKLIQVRQYQRKKQRQEYRLDSGQEYKKISV